MSLNALFVLPVVIAIVFGAAVITKAEAILQFIGEW